MKQKGLLTGALLCLTHLISTAINVIPYPNKLIAKAGSYSIHETRTIFYYGESIINANYLQHELFPAAKLKSITKMPKGKTGIFLELLPIPEEGSTESYQLNVSKEFIHLSASSHTGLFYGIQTLRQLIADGKIPCVEIEDAPRFTWRAYMLDVSRHFRTKEFVKQMLDEMALLKMNVFHWHLTDDQGWRIEIKKYPKLTEVGGWRADSQTGGWNSDTYAGEPHGGFYSQEDIKEIIAYATDRHITVIPEIDMPGHARSAIATYPWLGVSKEVVDMPVRFGKVGQDVYDVADPRVFEFLRDVLDEVMALFPSEIIHIGGDEIDYEQWKNAPSIQKLMKEQKLATPADVQIYFTNKISNYLDSKGRRMMGWNEIMGKNIHEWQDKDDMEVSSSLAANAVVHFWKGDLKLVTEAATQGYSIVNSIHTETYLDYGYNSIPLSRSYAYNPIPEGLDTQHHDKIKGLGCQNWSEWTPTEERVEEQTFPRIAAYAEVGWTDLKNKNFERFALHLEAFKSRWEKLNIHYSRAYEPKK